MATSDMAIPRKYTVQSGGQLDGETFTLEFDRDEWKDVKFVMSVLGIRFNEFVAKADRYVSDGDLDPQDLENDFRERWTDAAPDERDEIEAEYASRMYKERAVICARDLMSEHNAGAMIQ